MTCYSTVAHDGAAPTVCASSTGKRRKRSFIDDEPPIGFKMELKFDDTNMVDNDEVIVRQNPKLISPSRTVAFESTSTIALSNAYELPTEEPGINIKYSVELEVGFQQF